MSLFINNLRQFKTYRLLRPNFCKSNTELLRALPSITNGVRVLTVAVTLILAVDRRRRVASLDSLCRLCCPLAVNHRRRVCNSANCIASNSVSVCRRSPTACFASRTKPVCRVAVDHRRRVAKNSDSCRRSPAACTNVTIFLRDVPSIADGESIRKLTAIALGRNQLERPVLQRYNRIVGEQIRCALDRHLIELIGQLANLDVGVA